MVHISRRDFVVGSAAGAVGIGAGIAIGHGIFDDSDPSGSVIAQAQAADDGEALQRYGTHRIVWSVPVATPTACISFDDGPDPRFTPQILEILDKAGVKASFNVMGYNAQQNPSILKEVVAAGHEIANHTWSHKNLAYLTYEETREEIHKCKQEVERILQQDLSSFRPPRGEMNGSALKICAEMGYNIFIWSMTRGSMGTGTPQEVASYMGENILPGDVLDLHDSIGRGIFQEGTDFAQGLIDRRTVEVEALPEALQRIADRGITLVPQMTLLGMSTQP